MTAGRHRFAGAGWLRLTTRGALRWVAARTAAGGALGGRAHGGGRRACDECPRARRRTAARTAAGSERVTGVRGTRTAMGLAAQRTADA